MERTSPAVAAVFEGALPDDPRVQRKLMFGHPAAFVNGHLFAGAYATEINLPLDEPALVELLALPGAARFEVMGRTMKGRAVVPTAMHGKPHVLREWLTRSLEQTAALPARPGPVSRSKKRR